MHAIGCIKSYVYIYVVYIINISQMLIVKKRLLNLAYICVNVYSYIFIYRMTFST